VEVDLLKQFPDEVIALQFTLLAKAIRIEGKCLD
jgi:hypothetical protein